MNKELYESIKQVIQYTDQYVFVTDKGGTEKTYLVNPDMLLTELENYHALEKEADWLAAAQNWDVPADKPTRCPEGKEPPDGCIGVNDCIMCWRKAACEAVIK